MAAYKGPYFLRDDIVFPPSDDDWVDACLKRMAENPGMSAHMAASLMVDENYDRIKGNSPDGKKKRLREKVRLKKKAKSSG